MKLEAFLKPLTPPPPKILSYRELIIFLLQLDQWVKESALYRVVLEEIKTRRTQGYEIAWITLEKLRRQLHSLKREGLLEVNGVCWRLRVF